METSFQHGQHPHRSRVNQPWGSPESVNAAYKTELIRARKPWRTIEEVELATLEWVHWFNTARLHESLGHRTPAEVESDYYADHTRAPALTTT